MKMLLPLGGSFFFDFRYRAFENPVELLVTALV